MSVLIKGMEMPESCKDCQLCAGIPLGSELVYHKCLPLNRLASKRSRRDGCPLVEVPTPHGRLIDADEFYQQAGLTDWNDLYMDLDKFQAFPTVIEAEGPKE